MEIEIIEIPRIELHWSEWYQWEDLKEDARRGGIKIPNGVAGVYEVKFADSDERLTIGETNNLRMRIRQGLVKGKTPHSTGDAIREKDDVSKLVVRWAVTERPCAAEEELHMRYVKKHGKLHVGARESRTSGSTISGTRRRVCWPAAAVILLFFSIFSATSRSR